jgi:hypothetical protein
MSLIIMLIIAAVVFALLWYAISFVPATPPFLKNILYIALCLIAAVWLWTKFVH